MCTFENQLKTFKSSKDWNLVLRTIRHPIERKATIDQELEKVARESHTDIIAISRCNAQICDSLETRQKIISLHNIWGFTHRCIIYFDSKIEVQADQSLIHSNEKWLSYQSFSSHIQNVDRRLQDQPAAKAISMWCQLLSLATLQFDKIIPIKWSWW